MKGKRKVQGKPNLIRVGRTFEPQNRVCAEIILADPMTYRRGSLIRRWADLFMANHPPEPPKKAEKRQREELLQRSLF